MAGTGGRNPKLRSLFKCPGVDPGGGGGFTMSAWRSAAAPGAGLGVFQICPYVLLQTEKGLGLLESLAPGAPAGFEWINYTYNYTYNEYISNVKRVVESWEQSGKAEEKPFRSDLTTELH